jgi:hypothetical protein
MPTLPLTPPPGVRNLRMRLDTVDYDGRVCLVRDLIRVHRARQASPWKFNDLYTESRLFVGNVTDIERPSNSAGLRSAGVRSLVGVGGASMLERIWHPVASSVTP